MQFMHVLSGDSLHACAVLSPDTTGIAVQYSRHFSYFLHYKRLLWCLIVLTTYIVIIYLKHMFFYIFGIISCELGMWPGFPVYLHLRIGYYCMRRHAIWPRWSDFHKKIFFTLSHLHFCRHIYLFLSCWIIHNCTLSAGKFCMTSILLFVYFWVTLFKLGNLCSY